MPLTVRRSRLRNGSRIRTRICCSENGNFSQKIKFVKNSSLFVSKDGDHFYFKDFFIFLAPFFQPTFLKATFDCLPYLPVAEFYFLGVSKDSPSIAISPRFRDVAAYSFCCCLKNVIFDVKNTSKLKFFLPFFQAQLFIKALIFNNNTLLSRKRGSRRNTRASKIHDFGISRQQILPIGAAAYIAYGASVKIEQSDWFLDL